MSNNKSLPFTDVYRLMLKEEEMLKSDKDSPVAIIKFKIFFMI